MKIMTIAGSALALALVGSAGMAMAQYGPPQGPPPGQYQQGQYQQGPQGPPPGGYQGPHGDWENAPPEFTAARQRGYHDGVEGARKDFENHRPPNVNNRDEFRHPNFIAPPDRRDYRFGFQRGYQNAVHHMYGGGPR